MYDRDGNVETITGYYASGEEQSFNLSRFDSYGNIVYNEYRNDDYYGNKTNTIEYNEHGFIISVISEGAGYNTQGVQIFITSLREEYLDVQCF